MSHTFSVRIVESDGDPVREQAVWANEVGIFGESATQYTDDDGWVEFVNEYWSDEKTPIVELWVRAKNMVHLRLPTVRHFP